MTKSQERLRELRERQSKERQEMAELSLLDNFTDEQRSRLDELERSTPDLERSLRAATVAVEEEDRAATVETGTRTGDAEQRERIELRSRCHVGRYLAAALKGRAPDGAEAELQAAAGVDGIPIELWNRPPEQRQTEDRAITEAPGTTGINLDTLRPAVFAPSVADKLMIEMPVVPSGTYATATLTTSATADAVAKSAVVPATKAGWTPQTTTPHRVGAGLDLTLEDIASVGTANFESLLRQHISLVLSDEIDDQLLNGDGQNDDLTGIFQRLTDPAAPAATVATFDTFVGVFADGIDGLWANRMDEVSIVSGPDTYKLSAKTFRDRVIDQGQRGGVSLGDISFADYARTHTAGWWTNKRMPDTANHVQQAVLCRKGRSMMPAPTRLAVCPIWYGSISVDDIYTGARKGERYFTLSVLLGDVILVQPAAYAEVSFRVST